MKRCLWPKTELDIAYHDTEWGVPHHDDQVLFEFLMVNDHTVDCFRHRQVSKLK